MASNSRFQGLRASRPSTDRDLQSKRLTSLVIILDSHSMCLLSFSVVSRALFLYYSLFFFSDLALLSFFYHLFILPPSTSIGSQSEDFLLVRTSRGQVLLTEFHRQRLIMDLLFTDNSGGLPSIESRMVEGDLWMALNASTVTIPAEARDYRSRKPDDHRATGPTGVFLEMEWALDMDWYDHDASWRPFIPMKPNDSSEGSLSESGQDWFFDLELSTPWEQGASGGFTIPGHACSTIDTDLILWSWLIDKITANHPFPCDSARPPPYNHGIILQGFSSCEELQAAGGVAKRTAVDYLGFLAWWTLSISQWEADLDAPVSDQIKSLRLDCFRKRGVLVDLERHWQEINIANLLRHRVPVAYPWSPSLSPSPRFCSLAPRILQVYNERRISTGGEVRSTDFDDWADDFAVIQQYDHFFQEIAIDGRPDPDVRFDDDWEYYVVDFQGWSWRRIPMGVAQEYYILFASTVDRESQGTTVLFRRWEPLDNLTDGLPHLVGPTESSEGCSSFTRGSCEIREMHKFKHAPVLGEHFDLDSCLVSPLAYADGSLGRTRPKKRGTQNELSPNAGRWLQLMASGSRQHRLRFSDSDSMDTSQSRPTSRISSANRSRDRSASPRPQTYPQQRTDFPDW